MDCKLLQSSLLVATIWEQEEESSIKTTHTSRTQKRSNVTELKSHMMESDAASFNSHVQSAVDFVVLLYKTNWECGITMSGEHIINALRNELPMACRAAFHEQQDDIVSRFYDRLNVTVPRESVDDTSSISQQSSENSSRLIQKNKYGNTFNSNTEYTTAK